MQVHDARVLGTAAVPALVVGIVSAVVCAVAAGSKGLLGAVLGVVLVGGFFSVSVVVVSWAARRNPLMLTNLALLTYVVKIVLLAAMLLAFRHVTFLEPKAFAWTVIACTLAWIGGEAYGFSRLRILYVDPGASQ